MKRTFLGFAVVGTMLLCGTVTAMSAELTVDEIVKKNTDARGGLEKLRALKSIQFTGKAVVGDGMEAETVMQVKRSGRVRLDMTVNGQKVTQATNGSSGWLVNPFMGAEEPQPMPDEMLADMREGSEMEGPLADYKAKGSTVELAGKEDVDGKPAYALKLTRKDGRSDTIYIDADSFLDVKRVGKRNMMGQEMEIETIPVITGRPKVWPSRTRLCRTSAVIRSSN